MAFVSFFWAGKKPKDPADKNLKSANPMGGMSFSEPLFHSLPVIEHLNSTTQKSLAWPFLTRWTVLTLLFVLKSLALPTHLMLPSSFTLSSVGGWCNSIEAPITGFKEWLQGSVTPVSPTLCYTCNVASHSQREAAWEGCVSLYSIWASKRSPNSWGTAHMQAL